MPSLALALLALFAPALALLAAGLPSGWTAFAAAAGIAALATATHVTAAVGRSAMLVAPAVAGLASGTAGWLLPASAGPAVLAWTSGCGLLLGLLAGLIASRTAGTGAAGIALLWIALALALPAAPGPTGAPAVEPLFAALALLVAIVALAARVGVGPLAAAARLTARDPAAAAAWGVPGTAVGAALGALAGFAAGLAGFFWNTATALGDRPPEVPVLALGLFAAVRLAGDGFAGLLAAAFLILGVPQLVLHVLPALPLGWIVAVAAALVAGGAAHAWGPLLLGLRPAGAPAAGRA